MRCLVLALALGCATPEPTPAHAADPPAAPAAPAAVVKQVVTVTTRDGVELEADLYAQPDAAPGVVLLHMIPPHWERSSWPGGFISSLTDKGWSVIAIDRRGAGKSKGVAKEAYEGETGRYDVEAAVKKLQEGGLGKLALIGASNGTTSALDYTAWAGSEGLPAPALLGFMTGGGYTENNTKISAAKGTPAIFTYSKKERAWSAEQEGGDPAWVFHEYPGGDHGTKMFEVKPEVGGHLVDALSKALGS